MSTAQQEGLSVCQRRKMNTEIESLKSRLSLAESRAASVERLAEKLAEALGEHLNAEDALAAFSDPELTDTPPTSFTEGYVDANYRVAHAEVKARFALTAYREQQKASQALGNHVRTT